MPTVLLFARLSFSHPAMLGWLVVALVPVLVHLWPRRSVRSVDWAAVDFLRDAIATTRRRLRLRRWSLLAVRILIVVLVVLSAAGPRWDRSDKTVPAATPERSAPIKLLIVGETLAVSDYLIDAIGAVGQAKTSERPIELVQIDAEKLDRTNLDDFQLVFLVDIGRFSPSGAQKLENYLQSGGRSIIWLGPNVSAERYNRELAKILPVRLERPVPLTFSDRPTVDPLGYQAEIIRPFADHPSAGLLNLPIEQYFRTVVKKDANANVLLATAAGDPLLVERPLGKGHLMIFTSSADLSWNKIGLWPSFVPLVDRMIDYMTGRLTSKPIALPILIGLLAAAVALLLLETLLRSADGRPADVLPERGRS
jgi:Aerotolerance regulator N-terminal